MNDKKGVNDEHNNTIFFISIYNIIKEPLNYYCYFYRDRREEREQQKMLFYTLHLYPEGIEFFLLHHWCYVKNMQICQKRVLSIIYFIQLNCVNFYLISLPLLQFWILILVGDRGRFNKRNRLHADCQINHLLGVNFELK